MANKEQSVLEKDYKDILQIFIEEKVQFLLVGGYAVGAYGYVRATKDLDLWVLANPENAKLIIKSLIRFGAPMRDVSVDDFSKEGIIFQIGVEPIRIDISTSIEGVSFQSAYQNAKTIIIDNLHIPIISLEDLIINKRASGRHRDLADVEALEEIEKRLQQGDALKR